MLLSLVDCRRGRPDGHSALDEEQEEIIRSTINAFFLMPGRPTVAQLVREVELTDLRQTSTSASPTVVARLETIDL